MRHDPVGNPLNLMSLVTHGLKEDLLTPCPHIAGQQLCAVLCRSDADAAPKLGGLTLHERSKYLGQDPRYGAARIGDDSPVVVRAQIRFWVRSNQPPSRGHPQHARNRTRSGERARAVGGTVIARPRDNGRSSTGTEDETPCRAVDDQALGRAGFSSLLEHDFDVVGEASNGLKYSTSSYDNS